MVEAFVILLALQAVQEPRASVVGTVRDAATEATVSGVVVTIPDLERGAVTGPDGRYVLAGIPAGPKHLVVTRLGYASRTVHALVPRTGSLRLDVSLSPRPIEVEGVEVRSRRPFRGGGAAEAPVFSEGRLTAADLRGHPLLAEPDAFRALGGGAVFVAPETGTGVHVRGGAADQTAFELDGIPVLNPFHSAGLSSAWNPDALASIELASLAPDPTVSEALSGTIRASTRTPGARIGGRGSLSSTQGRGTLDGPLGFRGAGFVASWRMGFPGLLGAPDEASYLRGETGDLLLKLESPEVAGGDLGLLLYESENEIFSSARVTAEEALGGAPAGMNAFGWQGRSLGASWRREGPARTLDLRVWRAGADADVRWDGMVALDDVGSRRRDVGIQAALEGRGAGRATEVGLRLLRIRTEYRLAGASDPPGSPTVGTAGVGGALPTSVSTDVATLFLRHDRGLDGPLAVRIGASVSGSGGRLHFGPRIRLAWRVAPGLTGSLAYRRSHQFTQSLSNSESLLRNVFPAELAVGGGDGVPVPRSDQGAVGLEWSPVAGLRLSGEAFVRGMEGIVLVAPSQGGLFSEGPVTTGSGTAWGASLEVTTGSARYDLLAAYGWQRVRLEETEVGFEPAYGTRHRIDAGVTVFPTATLSFRASAAAALGRRTTAAEGGLEWEACNLLDKGCEFAGTPLLRGPVGAVALPSYLRLDVGGRKHWHLRMAGRDTRIGVFATVTNVLGRDNVLAFVGDGSSGGREAVEMLPLSPLVVGIDWEF